MLNLHNILKRVYLGNYTLEDIRSIYSVNTMESEEEEFNILTEDVIKNCKDIAPSKKMDIILQNSIFALIWEVLKKRDTSRNHMGITPSDILHLHYLVQLCYERNANGGYLLISYLKYEITWDKMLFLLELHSSESFAYKREERKRQKPKYYHISNMNGAPLKSPCAAIRNTSRKTTNIFGRTTYFFTSGKVRGRRGKRD